MAKRKNSYAQRKRMKKANKAVSDGYVKLTRKYPQWRHDAIVEKLAEQFFLAPKTVDQIIRGDYERHFWKDELNFLRLFIIVNLIVLSNLIHCPIFCGNYNQKVRLLF